MRQISFMRLRPLWSSMRPAVAYSNPNSSKIGSISLCGARTSCMHHTSGVFFAAHCSMPLRFAARIPFTFEVVIVIVIAP